MTDDPQECRPHRTGREGEKLAAHWCQRHGYRILDHNIRLPGQPGEIDILAIDTNSTDIVAIEVKTSSTLRYGWPEERVSRAQQRRIRHLALQWITMHTQQHQYRRLRCDVLALDSDRHNNYRIHHIKEAF